MFFLFPFGGSGLCKCLCKHRFDSSSQMKRTMCHTSKEIIQPKSLRTHSPHLGQVGSNRKQVIHIFVLRSHENICFIQKLNTVIVCYNFFCHFYSWAQAWLQSLWKRKGKSTRFVKGLDNKTCAAFGKTTDTLQQSKFTRVTEAQGGEGEGKEGNSEERSEQSREAVRQDVLRCPHYYYFNNFRWYLEIMCLVLYSLLWVWAARSQSSVCL